MTERARIRVNLSQREIEVEGSEEFVRAYAERIEGLLEVFDAEPSPPPALALPAPSASTAGTASQTGRPDLGTFGAFVQHMPKSGTDVDKMLAAGYYAQTRNGDNAFGTGDANKLLAEQGVKVGNPSQCVKQNLVAKRVFVTQRGRYRVAQIGVDYLRQMMGVHVLPE
ncbi:hypothetical protein [Marinivivus vitaminiproducens]|uniref:hypothetical protein n=1 Tax=Marinivivus vitaminiproducens TaxID=3035935 RepID=UPI0027A794C9|nr:hypothetical protein P4R82_02100 [Geminicoccaceae bacterium SCSIO 64248]